MTHAKQATSEVHVTIFASAHFSTYGIGVID
jgi:hypothetical protein